MFRLDIQTSGAAFTIVSNDEDNGTPAPGPETARLLRSIAERIEAGETAGSVRDVNGSTVGAFTLTDD